MKSLITIDMVRAFHNPVVGHAVMSGLSHCTFLESVDLSYTNMTDCLEEFLGGDHKTHFPILKKLDLKTQN